MKADVIGILILKFGFEVIFMNSSPAKKSLLQAAQKDPEARR
jgi:hypothetical protein